MGDRLASEISGRVLEPTDPEFESARSLFNSAVETRPRLIAQCASAADVASALLFARRNELEIAVRGGGHSVAGASLVEDGLVIDMRRINSVVVDPDRKTVRVGGRSGLAGRGHRHPALRACHHRRTGVHHRRSRIGVGRRIRLGGAQVRPGLRQPARGRAGAGGRQQDRHERAPALPAVLGTARRRRQLRGGHLVDAAPPRTSRVLRGAADLAGRGRTAGDPRVPGLPGERPAGHRGGGCCS